MDVGGDDIRLAAHIRHLLLDYVHTHLTTDFIQFTQNAVAELVILSEIPTEDPTSLFLPADPFITLTNLLHLQILQPYDEKLQITKEVQTFIKKMLGSTPGKAKSERVIDEFSVDQDDLVVCRPMSPPILTRRAMRETPHLGASTGKRAKQSFRDFVNALPVQTKLVPVDVVEIQEPEVNITQVLDIALQLSAADHTAVRELFKSVSIMSRPPATADRKPHPYLPYNFFHLSSSNLESAIPLPDSPPFMPIFPRRVPVCPKAKAPAIQKRGSRQGNTITATTTQRNLNSVVDLPAFIGAEITNAFGTKDEETFGPEGQELHKENMVIVDGWHTLATSSPSVLSSVDDDEVDQLLSISSPDTELSPAKLIKEVEDSKMEVIQIPRVRRIRGLAGIDKGPSAKIGKVLEKGLGAFLGPLLTRPSGHAIRTTDEKDPGPANAGEKDHSSTWGQPPSPSGTTVATIHPRNQDSPNQPDDEIYAIYTLVDDDRNDVHVKRHPNDLIRDEMLFDEEEEKQQNRDKKMKDNGMIVRLMPVPTMPAPNAYVVRSTSGFRSVKDYMVDSNEGIQAKPNPLQFLKAVKGMASLRVSLSWVVPFTVTSPNDLPNHARLLEIDTLLYDNGRQPQTGMSDVQKLLERSLVVESDVDCDGDVVERLWKTEGGEGASGENTQFSFQIPRCEIILTRAERMALARSVKGARENEYMPLGPEEEGLQRNITDAIPGDKKTRQHGIIPGDNGIERPAKRARLTKAMDDSGIGLMPEDVGTGLKERDRDKHHLQEDDVLNYEDDAFFRHDTPGDDIDMLADIYNYNDDHETMLTEINSNSGRAYSCNNYEYDRDNDSLDANKENCPPPMTVMNLDLQQANHNTWYQYSSGFDDSGDGGLREPDGTQLLYSERSFYDEEEDYAGGSFEPLPLSFDSQAYQATKQFQSPVRPLDHLAAGDDNIDDDEEDWYTRPGFNVPASGQDTWNFDATRGSTNKNRMEDRGINLRHPDLRDLRPTETNPKIDNAEAAAYENMDLATRVLGINAFAMLRAKTVKSFTCDVLPSSQPLPSSATISGPEQEQGPQGPRSAPQDLYDCNTLRLPSPWIFPMKTHRYMASLDLLQKQVLVRSLRTAQHLVQLVERLSLGGADLILDPYTAVIFAPLLSLPSQCESLLNRVSTQSYLCKCLLVVFEAYPVSRSFRPSSDLSDPAAIDLFAYTPPVTKAVKKFRRDLDIREACGTKAATCEVKVAFADSVDEAAAYTRYLGDLAEQQDETQGAVWGGREWLDLEIAEEEADLVAVGGMNHFSASIVLSQVTAQQYLDMTPEERIESFAQFIGVEAIVSLSCPS
ncbi:hypothetical protein L208DRAFT_1355554 [Tricholoma matsutake]|nr:hypothetical protein L208DRAFT_1355554 [Tricholoma matsutake 945]